MARQRNPAQSSQPATSSRKRSRRSVEAADDEVDVASSSKRSNRGGTPSRRVGWNANLEQPGNYNSYANHRQQSPVRSALHREPDEDDDEYSRSDSAYSPGEELDHLDECGYEPARVWDEARGDDLGIGDQYYPPRKTGRYDKQQVRKPLPLEDYVIYVDPKDLLPDTTMSDTSSEEGNRGSEENLETDTESPEPETERPPPRSPSVHAPRATSFAAQAIASPPVLDLHSDEEALDAAVCDCMHNLTAAIKGFVDHFPTNTKIDLDTFSKHVLRPEHEKTVRYIGCLALGGRDGENSWKELLCDVECRRALVFGMIGRALEEHVFSELWFGGSEEQCKELSELEQRSVELDGFERTKQRAKRCVEFEKSHSKSHTSSINLDKAKAKVVMQLATLLDPLMGFSRKRDNKVPQLNLETPQSLAPIVRYAAELSRLMRQMDGVVYYWPPTFKDEEFEPGRMECRNLSYMLDKCPYKKKTVHGRVRPILQPNGESCSEAIVRVVCFPGLVAYRSGGGDAADDLLKEESHRRSNSGAPKDVIQSQARQAVHENTTKHSGFRTKVICKAVVHLQWGKQRLLTKEAGTSAHLDAMREGNLNKYDNDRAGFVELWEIFARRRANSTYRNDAPAAVLEKPGKGALAPSGGSHSPSRKGGGQ